ncbi:hypothetical protein GOP47_0013677 [Adiantum capillus-veneris]|uniref:Exonuclease domain-containing protein n=1 Tax=Adiantum capillus-veneris TaxID=13818 RepID=A0A9D4ZG04_ADICA|nr:hypothetical protein GOP47_0013677 [Adiantum capillus-veneris]
MPLPSSSVDAAREGGGGGGEEEAAREEEDNDIDGEQKVSYFDVYGPQGRPEIIFPPPEKETKISIEDIQGLVRWVLADGTMPGWVFIKNKPLISKLVLVYVPGLDAAAYMSHSRHVQNLARCCGKPHALLAPRFIVDPNQSLEAFFTVKSKKRKSTGELSYQNVKVKLISGVPQEACEDSSDTKESNLLSDSGVSSKDLNKDSKCNGVMLTDKQGGSEEDTKKQFPSSYYTLTEAEMQEHQYPLCANDSGYVQTQAADGQSYRNLVALDCEMCYTKDGLELTRVSLVDEQGKVLFDSLVKPSNPIIDYNTKYSGITHEMMDNVTTTIKDVQVEILKIISADTILVGHSLENDLAALKLVHRRIIDTALLYRHPRGLLFRPALRILASQFLNRRIQHGNGGHNSIEDAQAAMDLVLLKIRGGPGFGNSSTSFKESLLSVLSKHGNQCSVIDRASMLQRYAVGPCHAIPCATDDEALSKAKKEVRNKQRKFVWVQFSELQKFYEEEARDLDTLSAHRAQVIALLTCDRAVEKESLTRNSTKELKNKLSQLDDRVRELHSALDSQSMLLVVSGHGDIATVRRLRRLTRDKLLEKEMATQKSWASILGDIQAEAETAVAFVCVKS